jgi:S-formylglutathione hydrolase
MTKETDRLVINCISDSACSRGEIAGICCVDADVIGKSLRRMQRKGFVAANTWTENRKWFVAEQRIKDPDILNDLLLMISFQVPMADMARQGITWHSMGGHGALTIALRNAGRFRSVSAFSPIVAPLECPWGEKALGGYLGPDRAAWRAYDACALIADGARLPDLLVDQGEADNFLAEQLKTHLLVAACAKAGIPATIRMQPGYDHSYYFISSFMAQHVAWHAERLGTD